MKHTETRVCDKCRLRYSVNLDGTLRAHAPCTPGAKVRTSSTARVTR